MSKMVYAYNDPISRNLRAEQRNLARVQKDELIKRFKRLCPASPLDVDAATPESLAAIIMQQTYGKNKMIRAFAPLPPRSK